MPRIFDFATVTAWDGRLQALAAIAEPERWSYHSVPSRVALPILDNYVRYTFMRAFDQQKIVEADRVACFNTGLLTTGQEEIFGLFTISEHYDRTKPISAANKNWCFKSWVPTGLTHKPNYLEFRPLVEYWSEPSVLVFDPKLQVQLNLDHIINDNLNRFPEELGGRVNSSGQPTDLNEEEDEDEVDAAESSGVLISVPMPTRNAVEGALKHSIMLAQRSYRIAVPQFYRGKVQLLLPIYLRDPAKPDLALTLERHGGWYRAATVLYPDWAYKHARLLARPNSEWLGGFRGDLAV